MEISSSFGGGASARATGADEEGVVVQAAKGSSNASEQVRRTEVIRQS